MIYWDEACDKAVVDWKTANRIEQFRIYNLLIKPLKYMAISILKKYFTFNFNDTEDIVEDAINHLFCNLHKYDPSKGKKSFSYCQTIIRNYYSEVCRTKMTLKAVMIEYADSDLLTTFEYHVPIEPEAELDFEDVFRRLEQARWKLLQYVNEGRKNNRYVRLQAKNEAEFLRYVIEFLHQYKDSDFDLHSIHEYAMEKTKLSNNSIGTLMRKHFGIMTKIDCDYKDVDGRIVKEFGVINDDYPGETPKEKIRRRKLHREIYGKNE